MDIDVMFDSKKLTAKEGNNYVYLVNGLGEVILRLENEVFLAPKEQRRILV